MANFNEKINSHKEFVLRDMEHDYFIRRIGSMNMLKLEFGYNVHYLKSGYRLFIQYKDTCRVQKMAGRCFVWSCTSNASGISDVRRFCLDLDVDEDIDNVENPIFNHIAGAVLISEKGVITYGDTWFETFELEKNYVTCCAYICGRMVSGFRIPSEAFDLFFGLNENFPKQYEEVFGKTEDAKPVQSETKSKCKQAVELMAVDLINDAKRKIELCKILLDTNASQLERASDAIKLTLMDIDDQKCELDDMLAKLDDTLRKLK